MTIKRIVRVSALIALLVTGLASVDWREALRVTHARVPPQERSQKPLQDQPKQFAGLFKASSPELRGKSAGPEEMAALRRHVEYLRKLADQGVLILGGHTLNHDESAFGIVIFRADSEATASAIMDADPLVRAHIVTVAVFPFEALLGRDPRGDNEQQKQQ